MIERWQHFIRARKAQIFAKKVTRNVLINVLSSFLLGRGRKKKLTTENKSLIEQEFYCNKNFAIRTKALLQSFWKIFFSCWHYVLDGNLLTCWKVLSKKSFLRWLFVWIYYMRQACLSLWPILLGSGWNWLGAKK